MTNKSIDSDDIPIGNFQDSSNNNSHLQHKPTQHSRIFFISHRANLESHDERRIYIEKYLLIQNPLVTAKRNWLKNGKKKLLIEASSLSAPVAMTVIGRKKMSLAKKIKISDLLLNIPLNYATYFPTVSPTL